MGGWTKTKLMLNSTQVEVEVEVGVELGKKNQLLEEMGATDIYSNILLRKKETDIFPLTLTLLLFI